MPDCVLAMIAELFNDIEDGKRGWPKAMSTGITTCIPKGDDMEGDAKKELELTAADPSQTRPITNVSAVTALYDACRCQDLEELVAMRKNSSASKRLRYAEKQKTQMCLKDYQFC